jgi:N-glycosylase/DNA lyase
MTQTHDGVQMDCTHEAHETVWKEYFDWDTDYAAIRAAIDPSDAFLVDAARFGAGIRILRQDAWEMLVSFIISQRKNIPAIRKSVEMLCQRYGESICDSVFAFPTAQRLAALDLACLLDCSLGYRGKYIQAAAMMVASGAIDLEAMRNLDDDRLLQTLKSVPGVGEKVANCVMLFGYHRLARFPVDVWIERVFAREYPEGFPFERYEGIGGVLQQYIFYYARSGGMHADRNIPDETP